MKSAIALFGSAAALGIAVVLAVSLLADQFRPVTIEIAPALDAPISVKVEGAVVQPGGYQLPANARINDAIQRAGGLTTTADTAALNLAARLTDGETLRIPTLVPAVALPSSADPSPSPTNAEPSGLINLNSASAAELESLPGIGEVLADRIVSWREQFGPFTSIEQLTEIEGISARIIEEIRPLVTLGG